jgi:hypothetical protein
LAKAEIPVSLHILLNDALIFFEFDWTVGLTEVVNVTRHPLIGDLGIEGWGLQGEIKFTLNFCLVLIFWLNVAYSK